MQYLPERNHHFCWLMKKKNRNHIKNHMKSIGQIIFSALIIMAMFTQMLVVSVSAQKSSNELITNGVETNVKSETIEQVEQKDAKIAPDLETKTDNLNYGLQVDETVKVIIQLKAETPLNEMFGNDLNDNEKLALFGQEVRGNKAKALKLKSNLAAVGGKFKNSFANLGLVTSELPLSRVRELIENDEVAYISPDRETQAAGHLVNTTGYWNTGIHDNGDTNSTTWLDGGNQTIAVIDSGVDSTHKLMQWEGVGSKVWKYDFTGQNIKEDLLRSRHARRFNDRRTVRTRQRHIRRHRRRRANRKPARTESRRHRTGQPCYRRARLGCSAES